MWEWGLIMRGWRIVAALLLPLTIALVSAMTPAAAQSNPVLPAEVRANLDQAVGRCSNAGGRLISDPDIFASQVELNGDGRPDWILRWYQMNCTSAARVTWCDPATGCLFKVLVSQGDRLREAWTGNVYGHTVIDVGRGRKGVLLSLPRGAQLLAWNGTAMVAQGPVRSPTDAESSSFTAEAERGVDDAPAFTARGFQGKWISGSSADTGPIAALTGHPQLPIVMLRCIDNTPVFSVRLGKTLPDRAMAPPPEGKPLYLYLGAQSGAGPEEARKVVALAQSAASPIEFNTILAPEMLALLAGPDAALNLAVSNDAGSSWLPSADLPLAGSTAAIRAVTAACASGAATPKAASAPASATVAPPAAKPGSFAIDISLSSRAAARLANREGIRAVVYIAGSALPAHMDEADMEDEIDLGSEDVVAPGQAGRIVVTGKNFKPERLGWIERGSGYILVNIVTARRSSPNNLIDCDPLISGSIEEISGRTFAVQCKLITEN